MEQVIDALRREIGKWVRTVTPLTQDAMIGDSILKVRNTGRFQINDTIVIRNATEFEKPIQYRITEITDRNTLVMSSPIALKNWTVSENAVVQKLIHGNVVADNSIYIGDPENIPEFPAIVINGISEETPEWLTLDSVKDVFNVEITIFVEDSTQEEGYRYLLRLAKLVKFAMMNNIFPLVNDYETTTLTADANPDDVFLKVADTSAFSCGNVILIEDMYKSVEHRVDSVVDATTLKLFGPMPSLFEVADGVNVVKVNRFIFNSYPKDIQYGKVHKGTLLKAAVINWFGWEEVVPPMGGDGWIDPQTR